MSEPTLLVALQQLVQQHGRKAVLDAVQEVGRRHTVEASREQMAQIAVLIDQLAPIWKKNEIFGFLTRQKGAGIPVAISIEILDRIAQFKPSNPWALVNTIMTWDYPGYKWGRS